MTKFWQGLAKTDWKLNLRNVNGLALVAGVLCATIAMAGASEIEYQRQASAALAEATKQEGAVEMKLAHCPLAAHGNAATTR